MARRALVLIPLMVALLAMLAASACRSAGINLHGRELALAAVVCGVAAELAMIPLVVTAGGLQPAVAQAGLVATVVHMLTAAAGGMAASVPLHDSRPFFNWLLLFYFATLIAVCIVAVRAVKSAPMQG